MKRTASALTLLLALLFSAVAGTQLVNLGKANPFSQSTYSGEMHSPASATPPSITILHPENNKTYNENFVNLTLYALVGKTPYSLGQTPYHPPTKIFHGLSLTEVYFETDWLQNKTAVNGTSTFTYVHNSSGTSENFNDNFYGQTTGAYSCNLTLEDIPEGKHNITVKATERGYYYYVEGGFSFEYYGYSISTISSVHFTVDTVPTVSFLSFENTTTDVSDVPLNFTVNQAVSKIAYCLDGQKNVTISGNTTLTELPNGEHNITVYATDETGNTGASKTIYFSVEVLEPFQTTMVIAPTASVTAVSLALLVYSKKRKR